jgi:Flp pilus assembly protein CpaB
VLGGFQTETASGRMRPVLRLLAEDVLVLTAPDSGPNAAKAATSGSTEQQVTIRVGRNDAERLAFAADNGKLWLALRPPTGTRVQRPKLMTLERVLAGSRPLPTEGSR